MAKIYNFELKGIKLSETGLEANLYYENKKIAIYKDDNAVPSLTFESKVNEEMRISLSNKIKSYYEKFPKEIISNDDNSLMLEFIEELYRLRELENIFKKVNKKNNSVVLELRFSKRISYITDFIKDDVCLSTSKWDNEFKEKMLEKYKPAEYTIYKNLDDFNID